VSFANIFFIAVEINDHRKGAKRLDNHNAHRTQQRQRVNIRVRIFTGDKE
jgi:hypothetical protein